MLQEIEKTADSARIPAQDRCQPCPLSPAQERLWFLEQFNPELPVYNESEAVRLAGPLDVAAIEQALNIMVARQDILRTTIQRIGEQPMAVPLEGWRLKLVRISLMNLAAGEKQAELERLLIDEPRRKFHLETEPGIRATLIEMGPEDHVLILMMHDIICDWSSAGVIWRELSAIYRALLRGHSPELPPLLIQHGDYAAWQKEQMAAGRFDADLQYWKDKLRGVPALLELPTDRTRPAVKTYQGACKRYAVGTALVRRLRNFSRDEHISLQALFTAALDVLLHKYTGANDVSVGISLANRDMPELEHLIGFLLHTHVLRTQLTGDMCFRDLLGQVQKELSDLYTHRAPPFDQVVSVVQPERNLSYSPLFQVMINWRARDQQLSFIGMDGLRATSLLAETRTAKYDLTFMLTEDESEIWLELEYSTDLYDEGRIDRMVGHYQALLEGILANPGQSLVNLPLLTEFERQQLLHNSNRTATAFPSDRCLHEIIAEQVKRTPEAVAVVFQDKSLTCRELNQRANQLAGHLRALGVNPDDLVAICLERSLDMVVALLGVLKAGGAYLPMDASFPQERLLFMAQDARPKVLLTQATLAELIPAAGAQVVLMDRDWSAISRQPVTDIANAAKARNLAYVLYTSGSTGKPKGVQIEHQSLVNFLYSMRKEPGLEAGDKVLAITTLSFDIAGLEIWLPLLTGAQIILVQREVAVDGLALARLLERSGATVMQATPSTWQLLLTSGWQGKRGLKAFCGGEPWSADLARQLLEQGLNLWNLYGPTETTIWSAAKQILPGQEVLIGPPIANTQIYVLDQNLQPVPIGVPGELHIGGHGLARGYLNRPELTAEKFIPDPFLSEPGARLYKTGDLARCLSDGNYEYLGRMDNQVKLRGFRIELGEIEAQLTHHASVRAAAVVAREDAPGGKLLAAYVLAKNGKTPLASDLRKFLQTRLPDYMVPSVFVNLERFPLTPNGKVDRKGLPKPQIESSTAKFFPPQTPNEVALAKIWGEVLGLQTIGLKDNFFELGGTSLLAMRLIVKIGSYFAKDIALNSIFIAPTIYQFSRLLNEKPGASLTLSAGLRGHGSGVPLFYIPQFHGFGFMPADLVSHLKDEVRYFDGLYYPGMKAGEPLPATVEEIAAYLIPQIQKIWPQGPYKLMGWSFGGCIAYEIARQMKRKNLEVASVLLIDSHALGPSRQNKISLPQAGLRFARRLWEVKGGERWRFLRETLGSRFGFLDLPKPEGSEAVPKPIMTPIMEAVLRASRNYRPESYKGKVVLFQIEDWEFFSGFRYDPDPSFGWRHLAGDGLKIITLPGDHVSIVQEPAATTLAQKILEEIS